MINVIIVDKIVTNRIYWAQLKDDGILMSENGGERRRLHRVNPKRGRGNKSNRSIG